MLFSTNKKSFADLKFDQKVLDELIADKALAQELQEILTSESQGEWTIESLQQEAAEVDQACKEILEAVEAWSKKRDTTLEKYLGITEERIVAKGEQFVQNLKHPLVFAENMIIDVAKVLQFTLRLKFAAGVTQFNESSVQA